MILTAKKGKNFWKALYWARDKAQDEVVEVMRGCILAVVESGKYEDLPYPIQVNRAVAHLHDAYYQGRKWQYDFDATLEIVPGKRYYIRPQMSKANQHTFDFLTEQFSPFREVPGKGVNWAHQIQCEVCTRDIAGGMFAVAEERIMQSATTIYPPYFRMLKKLVQEVEEAV
jgi:hypothetical protein